MRGLIERLQLKLRRWILGDMIQAQNALLVQSALIIGTGENLVRQNGLVLQELARLRAEHATLVTDSFSRNAAVREELDKVREGIEVQGQVFRIDSKAAIAELKDSVDRLVELVTPKAERLQGRRPVGGWDQVVADNLKQFQEPVK